jgi:hypothetical protein
VSACRGPAPPGTRSDQVPHGSTVTYLRVAPSRSDVAGCTLGGVSKSKHPPQHHTRMTPNHLAGRSAFCQLLLLPTRPRTRGLPRFSWQFIRWSSQWVVHPTLPCRLLVHHRSQAPMVTDRLDLLRLGGQPSCGQLYPLRYPDPLPPSYWFRV